MLMEKKKESRSGMEIMNLLQVSTIYPCNLDVASKISDFVIIWYL